ncbi:hypothetical protein Q3G72_015900 [Acer saccharum]|nr:hypothetical protein Q3G72_015900 [Acer saccharum]
MVHKSENPHKSMGQEFAYEEGVLRSPNYKLGSVGGSLPKNDIGHGTRFLKTKEITKPINSKEKEETVGNAKQQVRESHSDLDKVNQLAEAHRVVWNLVQKRWGVRREETNGDKLGAVA